MYAIRSYYVPYLFVKIVKIFFLQSYSVRRICNYYSTICTRRSSFKKISGINFNIMIYTASWQ